MCLQPCQLAECFHLTVSGTLGLALGGLWANELTQFINSLFTNPDRMIVVAVLIGALALFIITRGKWR
jgi:hypothetical protein